MKIVWPICVLGDETQLGGTLWVNSLVKNLATSGGTERMLMTQKSSQRIKMITTNHYITGTN